MHLLAEVVHLLDLLLEQVLGESFRDWIMPRERSGGMVGGRPVGQGQARNGRPDEQAAPTAVP